MINLRKVIFYLKDSINGGLIAKHIKDLNFILSDIQFEASKNKIDARRRELLQHALKNVPYYKNNMATNKIIVLESFPVINKNIVRDNVKDFISLGYDVKMLSKAVTSGSTGTPFFVYHDANKKARNTADTIYFGEQAGFTIGTNLNYLKIWTKVNKKNKFSALAENILPIDVTQLSDENIEKLVVSINQNKFKKAFLGYASALESIVNYLEKNKPEFRFKKVTAVIAMSEAINDNTKHLILKYFGVHCVSRYSNVENGIIAQQKNDGSSYFRLNSASYEVEILDIHTDKALENGVSGRIVITDYFNKAMPLIRYDTGDIGIVNFDEESNELVLKKVEGRKMDMVFNTSGNLVSSFTITNNMWLYPEIKQYQFIQLSLNSYKFKLNTDTQFNREAELINEFKKHFGGDADITLEYVHEIPLLNSGKRKKVINEHYV